MMTIKKRSSHLNPSLRRKKNHKKQMSRKRHWNRTSKVKLMKSSQIQKRKNRMIYKKINMMKNQKKATYNCWHKLVQRKMKQNMTSKKEKLNQNLKKLIRIKRVSKNLKMMVNFSKQKKILNRQKMKHNKMKNKWKMRSSLSNQRILLNPIQQIHKDNKIQNQ